MTKNINNIRKKITKLYEEISTATHEAGHTIFALLHHMKVDSVFIFENKKTKRVEGLTVFESIDISNMKDKVLFNSCLQNEIRMRYAGLTAEKYFFKITSGSDKFPIFLRDGSSDDTLVAAKLIRQYNVSEPGKKRYLYKKRAIKETLSDLQRHWDAVVIVAHELFKRKKLTYADLSKLLIKKSNNKEFWKEQFKLINGIFDNHPVDEKILKTILVG